MATTLIVLVGCGDPLRGPGRGGGDSSVTLDGATGDGATGDGATGDAARPDTGIVTDSSLPDTLVAGDSSTPNGQCAPACLAMSGAVCCTTCGTCAAEVSCEPICPVGTGWDCERECCFDTTGFACVD